MIAHDVFVIGSGAKEVKELPRPIFLGAGCARFGSHIPPLRKSLIEHLRVLDAPRMARMPLFCHNAIASARC
jgi:hypothetical protein